MYISQLALSIYTLIFWSFFLIDIIGYQAAKQKKCWVKKNNNLNIMPLPNNYWISWITSRCGKPVTNKKSSYSIFNRRFKLLRSTMSYCWKIYFYYLLLLTHWSKWKEVKKIIWKCYSITVDIYVDTVPTLVSN